MTCIPPKGLSVFLITLEAKIFLVRFVATLLHIVACITQHHNGHLFSNQINPDSYQAQTDRASSSRKGKKIGK